MSNVEARQVAWLERRYRELEAETLADLQGHIRISRRLRGAVRDEAIIMRPTNSKRGLSTRPRLRRHFSID